MKKNFFIILFLFLLLLTNCKNQEIVYNLKQELEYAGFRGEIFVIDYMKEEAGIFLGKGWTKLRKDGTRLGVYPNSKLNFIVPEIGPLYLFCLCAPFKQGNYPVKNLRIKINGEELEQVDLRKNISRYIKIPIPSQFVENGENIVEFTYITDKILQKEKPSPKGKMREFSLIFYELLLSSHANFRGAKRFAETKERLVSEGKGVFIQKIPSAIDFFLEIPAQSFLKAQYKLYLLSEIRKKDLDFQISVREPEKEEKIVYQSILAKNTDENELKIDLSFVEGISRLRLKVGQLQEENTLTGFLIWREASIIKRREGKERNNYSNKNLNKLRQSLSDKNTIIIILDAARADHFSNYGYFRPTTPNISRFAEEATMFTNAFSESLTTRCSIGTLFTGFPLSVTSLTNFTSRLPDELITIAQLYKSKQFKTTGFTGVGNVGSSFNFHRGFDAYFELYKKEDFYRKSQQYLPYLLPWLETNKKKNFFLYVHFKEPHALYMPLPPFRGLFSDKYKEKVDLTKYQKIGQDLTDEQVEYIRACYDENLASADAAFGEIVKKMEKLDLIEKSIIILTSDHGELLGEHGRAFGHGGYFGEGGIHIPLIIRFPRDSTLKIPPKIKALVKTSDLFATLADIYQFNVPRDLIAGKSLLPLLSETEQEINPYIIVEKRGTPGYCYRSKRYKLIYWKKGPAEFFDLAKDPVGKNNIYKKNDVRANFFLANLKKWIVKQKIIKNLLLKEDSSKIELDYEQIDKKTLENLKALGYIK